MAEPLSGLLVISLEQAVAAPLCTQRLVDAGARVIKVERMEGDFARGYDHVVGGESAYFIWLNRGKESLTLDIKDPADARLLHRIIAKADIFVQNLAPHAAERAGFGSADLRARHPRLITCDITGYGEAGPLHEMKAYDLLIQCETGLASITGSPEAPGRVGVSLADLCCGQNAHAAILQALFAREKTGRGQGISTSLFAGMADWMTVPLLHFEHTGVPPQRVGLKHPSIAPYGAYATADGKQVVISIQNEREWSVLCARVLGNPALATDPRFETNVLRVKNRPQLDAAVQAVTATLTRDQLTHRLQAHGIAFASVNGLADLSSHPQLQRVKVELERGNTTIPAPPWEGSAQNPAKAVPRIGEHSAALRTEFAEN